MLRGALERFTPSGVVLAPAAVSGGGGGGGGGSGATAQAAGVVTGPVEYDAVILATGFRPKLLDFLRGDAASALLGTERDRRGAAEPTPLVDRRSRSTVRDSIYFVGFDQFRSTLSIGPVLGYRGYDVGAEIAAELYGTPQPLRYPSLPPDEQAGSKVEWTPRQMLAVMGVGVLLGAVGGRLAAGRAGARAVRRTPLRVPRAVPVGS